MQLEDMDSLGILSKASRLRTGVPCSLADETPFHGGSHRVFKVVFEDSLQWAARICDDTQNWKSELRAVKQFQYIKTQRPEMKAPNLFVDEEFPVLYSEWISGKPLAIWNHQVSWENRQRMLSDLAEFLLQTWTIHVPPDCTPVKNYSYSAWLTDSLDRGLRRTLNGTARWGDAVDYLIMRAMIPEYAAEVDSYSDFGFTHGDLNAHNIMRSDEFYLTGILDWDWMFVAPLPAIIHHPWFIADIPGWKNDGVEEGESFAEDQIYLENLIRMKEASLRLPPTISTLLCGSGKRLFFQSAFHYKEIHESFVKANCPRTEGNIRAAKLQFEAVLSLYPELGDSQGALGTREFLAGKM
ncbi:hypothetical protein N7540_006758 [Penicillium herquei]|nr:hypothetical protein N7540_006758 [Penicillium herquei]